MRKIMMQVFADITFLCHHNLMDYSLLLIVETNPKWIEEMSFKVRKATLKRRQSDAESLKVGTVKSSMESAFSE